MPWLTGCAAGTTMPVERLTRLVDRGEAASSASDSGNAFHRAGRKTCSSFRTVVFEFMKAFFGSMTRAPALGTVGLAVTRRRISIRAAFSTFENGHSAFRE